MNMTSLGTVDGYSVTHCVIKYTIMYECGAVMVVGKGGHGRVECQLYKEPDGVNVVQETNIYAMGFENDN